MSLISLSQVVHAEVLRTLVSGCHSDIRIVDSLSKTLSNERTNHSSCSLHYPRQAFAVTKAKEDAAAQSHRCSAAHYAAPTNDDLPRNIAGVY